MNLLLTFPDAESWPVSGSVFDFIADTGVWQSPDKVSLFDPGFGTQITVRVSPKQDSLTSSFKYVDGNASANFFFEHNDTLGDVVRSVVQADTPGVGQAFLTTNGGTISTPIALAAGDVFTLHTVWDSIANTETATLSQNGTVLLTGINAGVVSQPVWLQAFGSGSTGIPNASYFAFGDLNIEINPLPAANILQVQIFPFPTSLRDTEIEKNEYSL